MSIPIRSTVARNRTVAFILPVCLAVAGCLDRPGSATDSNARFNQKAYAATLGGGMSSASLRLEELTNACVANQVQSAFQVTNTGTTAVALSDVSIKMWVEDTTAAQQMVTDVNYGGCTTSGPSCVHQVSGVKATVTSFSPACGPDASHQANWEIAISTTDTTVLAAGGRWTNLQTGTHLGNFANFTPGTGRWFSPCLSTGGGFVSDSHYAVYYKGDLVFASGVSTPSCRGPQGTQQLSGYLTPEIKGAPLVGPVPANTPMQITVGLPVRNQAALKAFIQGVSSPTQPQTYRNYLTPQQYASNYGPLPADYQKVLDWATAAGFTVTKTYANNMLVSLRGTAAAVEKSLFLNLNYYSRPDGTQFYAPDREPSVNLALAVLRVSNLENWYVPTPRVDTKTNKLIGPTDIHGIYASCHPELLGDGQTIALFSYAAFDINDVQGYETAAGIAPSDFAPVVNPPISVDGASTTPATGQRLAEADLDVEMALSIAPKAKIVMYVTNATAAGTNDALALIANTTPLALQVSSSWGMAVDAVTQQTLDQFAAQGQSFFDASGDDGGTRADQDPGHMLDLENVTLVGGTEAVIDPAGTFNHEKAWSGSGGGLLMNAPIPYYQVDVPGLGSDYRNYPDVAAFANNVEWFWGGTMYSSCCSATSGATPLWAGFTALVNSASARPVGFINPAIYYIGQSAGYGDAFFDVTEGSNPSDVSTPPGNPTYYAASGWDHATGWGSPRCGLIDKLATPCAASDTDPHNCGACWHDCLGGACVGGVCQPVALTDAQTRVTAGPVVDERFVYWGTDTTVNKVPVGGGPPTVMTSGEVFVENLAVNSGSAFWYDGVKMDLRRQYFVLPAPTTIVPSIEYCYGLAVNESQIYWTDWYRKQVATAKYSDYAKITLASTNGYPDNIKIDSVNVYWSEFSPPNRTISIMKTPLAGGTPVELVTVNMPPSIPWTAPFSLSIDVDAAYVYWVDDTSALKKVPIAGGSPVVLATFPTSLRLTSLAVSGAAYVATSDTSTPNSGAIVRVPLGGGTPVTLVSGLTQSGSQVAGRGSAIYYTTQGENAGPIMKLAK